MGLSAHFLFVIMLSKIDLLNSMVDKAIAPLGYELIGIDYIPQGKKTFLRVYIDSPNGIDVDDCAKASHQISAALDVEDPIANEYTLEVSSPGLERPLFKAEHYKCYIGHKIKLMTKQPIEGRRNYSGILENVMDGTIQLRMDNVVYEFAIKDIKKAHLWVEW